MLKLYPRAVLAALLLINILGYIDRALILGFSPQITGDLGLTNTQFGLLNGAIWVLSYGVMAVVCGSLADRYSRTRLISIGMLIWSVCTAASGLADNFSHMVLARFLVATGEAALVPAGTALLADLFDEKHRATANGLFFMGIPLGIGLAYLLSGTLGAGLGWRGTFFILGGVGVVIAVALWFVKDDARDATHASRVSEMSRLSPMTQLLSIKRALADRPVLIYAIFAFVGVQFCIAANYFVQLWLVREMAADPASIARQIGVLQIVAGIIGAACGGFLSDWIVRHTKASLAFLPIVALCLCLPLMALSRFAEMGQVLLYVGLAASFLLPFSIYGSAIGLLQQESPVHLRSSIIGLQMLSLNIIALAIGSFFAGWLSDFLAASGNPTPLRWVMLTFDGLTALALIGYVGAARALRLGRSLDGAALSASAAAL
ncbi:MFS transporter [Pseudomonas sp. N040]|uniref:MFS transporter n=1 Tax=Pseudomonas sp. N040 TaxID=2785325 RepID=UPI0018A2D6AC|nr:MFS transporter [Pseudomonas sp. N040]MBF7731172.1 MFS transporter [Pseudomonas sp. N040]MBW7014815.1 MFS transporter [Pseudomonas sp. N040]